MISSNIVSYNQPKLCENATWASNGVTVINGTATDNSSRSIFVDSKNTLYATSCATNQILKLLENTNNLAETNVSIECGSGIFVGNDSGIYFESSTETGHIKKWLNQSIDSECIANFTNQCYAMFIDINNTLYCSMTGQNKVVKFPTNNINHSLETIPEADCEDLNPCDLRSPKGIFVYTNFTLYVADAGNNRIQIFGPQEKNGITVAGNGIPNNLTLNYPTDIILDANGNLFIADNNNSRIIRIIDNDYECIIGCNESENSSPDILNKPYALRFDSYGNLFIAEEFSGTIRRFDLFTNSCGKSNQ